MKTGDPIMSTGTAEPIATGSDTVALTEENLTNLFQQGAFQEGDKSAEEEGADEGEPEEVQESVAEEDQEPETDEITSFLSGLTDEQKRDLSVKLGGRLGDDIGRMRAEIRELRAINEAESAKRAPFQRKKEESNPYAKETDLKSLEETYEAAQTVVSEGEKLLRKHRNADPDDEVEFCNQITTISAVEDAIERARAASESHIPERVEQLRKTEGLETARLQNFDQVQKIHPWLKEDGELKTAFESVRDRYLPAVRDNIPEILPYFDQMLADHLEACNQRVSAPAKNASVKQAEKPSKKPPASPGGSAAASARPVPSSEKRSKLIESFTSSGRSMSQGDLERFLLTK